MTLTMESYAERRTWRANRKGIGSSDAPIILGIPFTTGGKPIKSRYELWCQKTGRIESDIEDTIRLRMGHYMERVIDAELGLDPGFQALLQAETRELADDGDFAIFRNTDCKYRFCTLDRSLVPPGTAWTFDEASTRYTQAGGVVRIPCEFKTVEPFAASDWTDDEPSQYSIVQLHHGLLVTGAPWGIIAALIGFGKLNWYKIERNAALIAVLEEEEAAFWKAVEDDVPPEVDGHEGTARALAALYPQDTGESIELLGSKWVDVALALEEAAEAEKLANARKVEAQNAIKEAMGEATYATIQEEPGAPVVGRYSWKHSTKRGYEVPPWEGRIFRSLKTKR